MNSFWDYILEKIVDWLYEVYEAIKKDPFRNGIFSLLSIFIIIVMSKYVLEFGVFTFVSYIFACIWGFTKTIENPSRPLVWSIGFIVGAEATGLLFNEVFPLVKENTAVSWFSALVIFYIAFKIWWKSRELQGY